MDALLVCDVQTRVQRMSIRQNFPQLDKYVKFLQYQGGLSDTAAYWAQTPGTPPLLRRTADGAAVTTVEDLLAMSEQAPCGKGEATIIDLGARKTKKVRASAVGVEWAGLDGAVLEAHTMLRRESRTTHRWTAALHDVLVYQPGDFFVEHRDSKKAPAHVATMSVVIELPAVDGATACTGGVVKFPEAGVEWRGDDTPFLEPDEKPGRRRRNKPSMSVGTRWCAWFASEMHSITEVTAGTRVVATFIISEDRLDGAPATRGAATAVAPPNPPPLMRNAITGLPRLVWSQLAGFLEPSELVTMSSVCRTFRSYCATHENVFRALFRSAMAAQLECYIHGSMAGAAADSDNDRAYRNLKPMQLTVGLHMKHRYIAHAASVDESAAPPEMVIDPSELRGGDATMFRLLLDAFPDSQKNNVLLAPVDVFTEVQEESEDRRIFISVLMGAREVVRKHHSDNDDTSTNGPASSESDDDDEEASQGKRRREADIGGDGASVPPCLRERERMYRPQIECDDRPRVMFRREFMKDEMWLCLRSDRSKHDHQICLGWNDIGQKRDDGQYLGEYEGNEGAFEINWYRETGLRVQFSFPEGLTF